MFGKFLWVPNLGKLLETKNYDRQYSLEKYKDFVDNEMNNYMHLHIIPNNYFVCEIFIRKIWVSQKKLNKFWSLADTYYEAIFFYDTSK